MTVAVPMEKARVEEVVDRGRNFSYTGDPDYNDANCISE